MEYGYARVSAADQNLSRQIEEFRKFGIKEKNIYSDRRSGRDFDRTAYGRLTERLKEGDLLVIKSIDRLGRNYDAIIEEWSRITNKIGADILVLDMPLLDTRTKSDTLVGKFISDIVLQVLSFVAENERVNIKSRQAEGIALARDRGVRFGRPSTYYTQEFKSVAFSFKNKNMSLDEAMSVTGMSRSTFYYHTRKLMREIVTKPKNEGPIVYRID